MIRKLKTKDKTSFIDYCLRQKNSDFYITKDNKRLFLNDLQVCKRVFNDIIKRSDICFVADDGQIRGILIVVGFADKASRKYVKVVADNNRIINNLFRLLIWNCNKEIFLKVKKESSVCRITKKYKFFFQGSRGNEVLFKRSKSYNNFKTNITQKDSNHGRSNNS